MLNVETQRRGWKTESVRVVWVNRAGPPIFSYVISRLRARQSFLQNGKGRGGKGETEEKYGEEEVLAEAAKVIAACTDACLTVALIRA